MNTMHAPAWQPFAEQAVEAPTAEVLPRGGGHLI
jgi:hypothetical protein